ncbi:uncharacterized protein METZ01_LOCUS418967, partial [marine metagenome]
MNIATNIEPITTNAKYIADIIS